ncbi:MAG: hypothetical protein WAL56_24045 [Candidatus Sulfotelmatobacter sp.]
MRLLQPKISRRSQTRTPGVLPVRVRGKQASGAMFEALAHTLDLTPTGARLGAIRCELKALDTLVVLFRKRRIEFTVMWTKLLGAEKNAGNTEYQVGLQMVAQECDPWGLGTTQSNLYSSSRATGAA